MNRIEFVAARSRISSELKMLVVEAKSTGLDEDTFDLVADRVTMLQFSLDGATNERELERIESGLGNLQMVVRQALRRANGTNGSH